VHRESLVTSLVTVLYYEGAKYMSEKMSRRQWFKLTAAGAAALGIQAVPGVAVFARPPQQESITLRFQENADNYSDIVAAFQEQFPNVDIEFVNVTGIDHAEIATKIMTQFAAGQPVDIGLCGDGSCSVLRRFRTVGTVNTTRPR
jgi:ABC-type glycerol-3-phosphate transport system substrate-binding protein